MTYDRAWNKRNSKDATSGAGSVFIPRNPISHVRFSGAQSLVFSAVFCRSLFVFLYFCIGYCIVYYSSIYGFYFPL
jgi:hypothetical protein